MTNEKDKLTKMIEELKSKYATELNNNINTSNEKIKEKEKKFLN